MPYSHKDSCGDTLTVTRSAASGSALVSAKELGRSSGAYVTKEQAPGVIEAIAEAVGLSDDVKGDDKEPSEGEGPTPEPALSYVVVAEERPEGTFFLAFGHKDTRPARLIKYSPDSSVGVAIASGASGELEELADQLNSKGA